MIDLSKCPGLERIPGKVSGVWLFRGTRLPLSAVLKNMASGATLDEVSDWFDIERSKIEEVLAFLGEETNHPLFEPEHAALK